MAHSFVFAENQNTKRIVGFPDSLLRIFIYFFNSVLEEHESINSIQNEIYKHYRIELLEVHISDMDLLLGKVSGNKQLKSWYLSTLSRLELKLNEFGADINPEYLNQVPELLIGYPADSIVFNLPIPVLRLMNIINDIYWVLDEGEYMPSGQYIWFEENI
jgi:hypothetical protein